MRATSRSSRPRCARRRKKPASRPPSLPSPVSSTCSRPEQATPSCLSWVFSPRASRCRRAPTKSPISSKCRSLSCSIPGTGSVSRASSRGVRAASIPLHTSRITSGAPRRRCSSISGRGSMTFRLDPKREVWMSAPATVRVLDALTKDGGDARFVGGVVRNAILRAEIADIDIATPLVPEDVVRRLEAAGIKAVPTGIDHGTITAIADGKSFEVTTLRRDVETDGRHAVIAFSKDWKEDAARRDFTMNALYAVRDGEVFDYFGGVEDAKAGHVRFVGDATARIREDYLRILRLFRFHAWYGKGEIDAQTLRAAAAEKAGIAKLSGERIQNEMLKLIAAESPA